MGARAYRTFKRVQQRGVHNFRGVVVPLEDDDVSRTINAQVLTKLGLHIDYAHSISLGYSKEKYYLILVVDGIDCVCGDRPALRVQLPRISFRSFLP
jgi:hypothetical protein